MKNLFNLFLCLFFLFHILGCGISKKSLKPLHHYSDAELKELLVGDWIFEEVKGNRSIKAYTTYLKDDIFIGKAIISKGVENNIIQVKGTWYVKQGYLYNIITESSSNDRVFKVNKTTKDKIIYIDTEQRTYLSENGTKYTTRRLNK